MATAKAVTEAKDNLPTIGGLDFNQMAGLGMEDASQDDFAIPFISIAQALSPQLDKQDSKYIEGLSKGDLFNTMTGERFDGEEGLLVTPVKFERKFLEFELRESGGGLVNVHTVAEARAINTTRDDRNRDITDNGTQLVDARSFYCIMQRGDGTTFKAMLSMSSTQAKKAKQWLGMINEMSWKPTADTVVTPAPMLSQCFLLKTGPESNKKGSWNGWVIRHHHAHKLEDSVLEEAGAFYVALSEGAVKVDYTQDGGGAAPAENDDEVPY